MQHVQNKSVCPLQELLELTEDMLNKASEEKWEELIELEKRREVLIKSSFPINEPTLQQRGRLETIIKINNEIERLCTIAKNQAQSQLVKLTSNKSAINAYQKN
jgi:hypothetical protein